MLYNITAGYIHNIHSVVDKKIMNKQDFIANKMRQVGNGEIEHVSYKVAVK